MWTRRVNSDVVDTNFFAVGWLVSGRVYCSSDSDLLTIAWLDTGTIFTLSDVDVSTCVLSALSTRSFDVNVVGGLVVSTMIRNFEVDMG